jgi:hypothetical protein
MEQIAIFLPAGNTEEARAKERGEGTRSLSTFRWHIVLGYY